MVRSYIVEPPRERVATAAYRSVESNHAPVIAVPKPCDHAGRTLPVPAAATVQGAKSVDRKPRRGVEPRVADRGGRSLFS